MKSFDFDATLDRFLTPQKVLSPLIFDDNEKMHEDIRQGLLKIADKIFELTIGKTNGLEPEDVCLIGSLSGYLYHQLYQSSYTGKIYKNYLIFKLLSKDGVLSQIQQSYVSCINQIFAFPSKQKISILTRIKRLFCIRKAICHDKL